MWTVLSINLGNLISPVISPSSSSRLLAAPPSYLLPMEIGPYGARFWTTTRTCRINPGQSNHQLTHRGRVIETEGTHYANLFYWPSWGGLLFRESWEHFRKKNNSKFYVINCVTNSCLFVSCFRYCNLGSINDNGLLGIATTVQVNESIKSETLLVTWSAFSGSCTRKETLFAFS